MCTCSYTCICNKLSSSHHALNSLLFALDGYPTATEDPAEIEETARTGTVGGGTGSGRECRDWVPLMGDPLFPSGRLYFSNILKCAHHNIPNMCTCSKIDPLFSEPCLAITLRLPKPEVARLAGMGKGSVHIVL